MTVRTKTVAWIACIAALGGCAGEMGPGDDRMLEPGNTGLRVLHLSPDAPGVDVYLDGDTLPAVANLGFTQGTDYLEIPAGPHSIAVTAAGAGASMPVLEVDGAELREGRYYTAIAFDELASPTGAIFVSDAIGTIPSGRVRLRAVHAAVGIGQVDVWALPETGDPELLFENVDFGDAADELDVPPGAHRLGIDANDDGTPDLRFDLPDLSAGTHVNLFAATDADGAPFLLAQLPGSTTARIDPRDDGPAADRAEVRAVHLSPNAPDVDVYVDGSLAFSGITFAWGTEYADVEPGERRIDVAAAGMPAATAVLSVDGLPLEIGKSYTVVAYDRVESIAALALEDSYDELPPGNIRVRAIHTASGVGDVDVWAMAPGAAWTRLADDLGFGTATDFADVPAGAYVLGLDVDDDGVPDLTFDLPGLVSGTVANVFAAADDAGAVFLLAQLRDGNAVRIDPSTATRPTGRVRVLHLSPDAPSVDVFANLGTTPIVMGLPFGSGTDYAAIPSGRYRFDVSASGSPATSAVLSADGLDVEPGTETTIVAYDTLGSIDLLAMDDDLSGLDPGNIRVRAIHAAPGITQADILNVVPGGIAQVLFYDLDFGEVSDYADIPAGQYVVGVDLDNNRVADARFELPHLPAGIGANVFAVADPSAVYLIAQLSNGVVARIDATP